MRNAAAAASGPSTIPAVMVIAGLCYLACAGSRSPVLVAIFLGIEGVGIIAANVYQNNVRGLFIQNNLTAQEFGYDGELDLSNYTFITTTPSAAIG